MVKYIIFQPLSVIPALLIDISSASITHSGQTAICLLLNVSNRRSDTIEEANEGFKIPLPLYASYAYLHRYPA